MEDSKMETLDAEVEPFSSASGCLDHDMDSSMDSYGISSVARNQDGGVSFGCDHCVYKTDRRKCLVNHLKRKHVDLEGDTSSLSSAPGSEWERPRRRRCHSEGTTDTWWPVGTSSDRRGAGGGSGCLCARCNLTRLGSRRKPPLSSEWLMAINYPLG